MVSQDSEGKVVPETGRWKTVEPILYFTICKQYVPQSSRSRVVPQENNPIRLHLVSLIKVIADAFQTMSSSISDYLS